MRVALIAVLGVVVGCGDDGVSVGTNESNFCKQIADVVCHNLYDCCTESEIEDYLSVSEPRTELQCREDVELRCERSAPDIRDSLEAGRVQFDSVRLNDCLNAVLAPDGVCSDVVTELPWREACSESPWVGTVQPDGACLFNIDCAGYPDTFCGPAQKCKAKPTAGFPCESGCASAFYCDNTTGTCAAKSAVGGPCLSGTQCQKDLYCQFDTTGANGMCAMKGAGGATCNTDAACVSGDCVPGKCQNSTQSCYDDGDCYGRCAISGSICTTSANCGSGTCSFDGSVCTDPAQCTGSATDTCLFPQACVPGMCIGEPVCTAQTLIADYCVGVGVIPNP